MRRMRLHKKGTAAPNTSNLQMQKDRSRSQADRSSMRQRLITRSVLEGRNAMTEQPTMNAEQASTIQRLTMSAKNFAIGFQEHRAMPSQNSLRERPVVKCLPRRDFIGGLEFWCPFCKKWHLHGRADGHRCAHCDNMMSPFYNSGYILKMMNRAELREFRKAIDEYLRSPKEATTQ